MTNNAKIILAAVAILVLGSIGYYMKSDSTYIAPAQTEQASVKGCYVSTLAKDVYTLTITSQDGENVSGTLAFKNFEKDSSTGTFAGTYKDGILLADYTFMSEGMTSVRQVIFKHEGNAFVAGYGDVVSAGDRESFKNITAITYDPKQTFTQSSDCTAAATTTAPAEGKKIAFSALVAKQDGAYKCTVEQHTGNIDTSGTAYINKGMVRGEFATAMNDVKINSTFIVRDGYSYTWSSAMPTVGFKTKTVSENGDIGASASASYTFNTNQIGDYNCTPWAVDETKFTIPTSVKFTDTASMKTMTR